MVLGQDAGMHIRAVAFDPNGTRVKILTEDGSEDIFRAAAHFLTYQGIDMCQARSGLAGGSGSGAGRPSGCRVPCQDSLIAAEQQLFAGYAALWYSLIRPLRT